MELFLLIMNHMVFNEMSKKLYKGPSLCQSCALMPQYFASQESWASAFGALITVKPTFIKKQNKKN